MGLFEGRSASSVVVSKLTGGCVKSIGGLLALVADGLSRALTVKDEDILVGGSTVGASSPEVAGSNPRLFKRISLMMEPSGFWGLTVRAGGGAGCRRLRTEWRRLSAAGPSE